MSSLSQKIQQAVRALVQVMRRHPRRSLAVLLCLGLLVWRLMPAPAPPDMRQRPQPVHAAYATHADVPVYLSTLGTITPVNTVLVQSRVSGELIQIYFTEGHMVEQGQLLAQIDPRPYEVQLAQARGAYAKDAATLKGAELDLERFKKLIKEGSIPLQQLQSQEALVGQYKGMLEMDAAQIADAQLQLSYCRITAPISGRVGLKRVDVGNMINSNDSQGLVVITQTEPMQLSLSIVEKDLPEVLRYQRQAPLVVEAWSQGMDHLLDKGHLAFIDNQIDTATGTVKAKANFTNTDRQLFPNQFVNVRVLVTIQQGALTVPSAAVQRDLEGFFVFIITPEETPAAKDKATSASSTAPSGAKAENTTGSSASSSSSQTPHTQEPAASTQGARSQESAGSSAVTRSQLPASASTAVATQETRPQGTAATKTVQENGRDDGQDKAATTQKRRGTVRLQKVRTGYTDAQRVIILEGLQADDLVVTDGIDRLRDGSPVIF